MDLIKYSPEPALSGLVQAIEARWGNFNPPKVTSLEELALADSSIAELKKQAKALDKFSKEAQAPVKDLLAKVKAYFERPSHILDMAEIGLKGAILAWHIAEEQKRLAQQAELQRQAEAEAQKAREKLHDQAVDAELWGGDVQGLLEAARAVDTPCIRVPEVKIQGATSTRKVRKWRLIDPSKVPPQYWMLNETLIGKECRSGYTAPPGIEFYDEETLMVRPGA